MPTPVHVVAGFLGTGKTTAVRALVAARADRERCAVVVNDFGEARIDATVLAGVARIADIAGGCVCCTAPEGLARTVAALLAEVRPDRILIEPSGLGRPQDIADMLARGGLRAELELMPTVVLVDPATLLGPPSALLDAQIEAADVLVANRCDLAAPEAIAAFRARAAALWPPPARVLETSFGVLPEESLAWPTGHGPRAADHDHDHDHGHAPSTEGYAARSFVWGPEVRFGWDGLRALLLATPGLVRFKGLFRADVGWVRVDVAGGRLHLAGTGYRRDSRADAIADDPAALDRIAEGLAAAMLPEDVAPAGDGVALVDADGFEVRLARAALAALPGQVPDVAALVPGKSGAGVLLRELFALVAPPPGARFVAVAADGMTSAPAPVAEIGDSVLVHSLGDAPLPEGQGGPFRLYAPGDAARGSCANVKAVVRIRVVVGAPSAIG